MVYERVSASAALELGHGDTNAERTVRNPAKGGMPGQYNLLSIRESSAAQVAGMILQDKLSAFHFTKKHCAKILFCFFLLLG